MGERRGGAPAGSPRSEIQKSWHRCALSGLTPGSSTASLPVADIDQRSRLMLVAAPVLDEVARHLDDTDFGVILADRERRIIDRRCGSPEIRAMFDKVSARPGCRFSEEDTGTNAVATPFEVRKPVTVVGKDHYLDELKELCCYGQPIIHPATRRLEGVLDITCHIRDANPLLAPFLDRAVKDIERGLLDGSRAAEKRLFAAFQAAESVPYAVLALAEDLVLANGAAVDLVETVDHALLRSLADDARVLGRANRSVRLSSGNIVDVEVERVGPAGGALFKVSPTTAVRERVPRRRPAGGLLPAGIARRLERCRSRRGRALITGEPGAGRTTAGRVLAGDAALAVLDAADLPAMGEAAWCSELDRLLEQHRGLVLVESVHLLPGAVAARLGKLIDGCDTWVALTSSPLGPAAPELAALASRCPTKVELPPLRARRDDIPQLARAMLAARLPGRSLRLTPSALEMLGSQPWPGNLRELEAVLIHAGEQRSGGDIAPRDLPAAYRCRSPRRCLSGLEQVERDAILAALDAAGGNKVHAAKHLGISRSTLYNRMRSLGIS